MLGVLAPTLMFGVKCKYMIPRWQLGWRGAALACVAVVVLPGYDGVACALHGTVVWFRAGGESRIP